MLSPVLALSARLPRTVCALLLVAILSTSVAFAQNAPATMGPRGQGSLSFTVGVPVGEFADKLDNLGYGANLFLGGMLKNTPFTVGLDASFLVYGRSRKRVPFSTTVGPAVNVDVVTTNSIVQPHLVLRLQPATGPVRPYLEGLIGFKYLFTETRVEDDRTDEKIASTRNFDDFAWSGGAGAGVDIRVGQSVNQMGRQQAFYLKLGVQYLRGQEAEYLAEGALEDTNNDGVLNESELPIRRSRTNLVQPMLGFAMTF
ncbi:hypothetical protein CRI94_07790 [Longibacter salinarum]|uniref:Outer membrane protein beta-barrel domain-containing protein n=1 Tax=Longibacter salinarum TaxID=1850348 RepID=A0A2A8CZE5_9BACT|nr:outer membrane beta-barrel protein [Longibacter salinarum]PEN13947.1 hypothetical protein CRI94_07790 [Longibacter salinarum]